MLLAAAARSPRSCAFVPAQASSIARHHRVASSESRNDNVLIQSSEPLLQSKLSTLLSSALLATVVLTSPINIQINHSQHSIIHITATSSANAYLTENQQSISQIWSAVTSQYYDPTFNGLGMDGWKSAERDALEAVQDTGPDDGDIVNEAISNMLFVLNDPYTRFLPKEKYDTLTAYATGSTTAGGAGGIGVQLLEDVRSNNVVVMGVTDDGPASKAGLRVGDMIVKIDGESLEGTSADVIAAKCRGGIGEKLELDFVRVRDDGRLFTSQHVTMTRSKITQNPVKATIFTSDSGKKIGLL